MGKVVRQGRAESTPEGLLLALSGLGPELKVAMEASRAWQRAPGALAVQTLEATLVHPSRPGPSPRPGRGSDRPDAHVLAQLLRADLVARA